LRENMGADKLVLSDGALAKLATIAAVPQGR